MTVLVGPVWMTSVWFIWGVDLFPSWLIRLSPVRQVQRHTGTQLFIFAWGFIPFPLLDIVNKAQRYFPSSVEYGCHISLFLVPCSLFFLLSLIYSRLYIRAASTNNNNTQAYTMDQWEPSSNPWKRDLIGLTGSQSSPWKGSEGKIYPSINGQIWYVVMQYRCLLGKGSPDDAVNLFVDV